MKHYLPLFVILLLSCGLVFTPIDDSYAGVPNAAQIAAAAVKAQAAAAAQARAQAAAVAKAQAAAVTKARAASANAVTKARLASVALAKAAAAKQAVVSIQAQINILNSQVAGVTAVINTANANKAQAAAAVVTATNNLKAATTALNAARASKNATTTAMAQVQMAAATNALNGAKAQQAQVNQTATTQIAVANKQLAALKTALAKLAQATKVYNVAKLAADAAVAQAAAAQSAANNAQLMVSGYSGGGGGGGGSGGGGTTVANNGGGESGNGDGGGAGNSGDAGTNPNPVDPPANNGGSNGGGGNSGGGNSGGGYAGGGGGGTSATSTARVISVTKMALPGDPVNIAINDPTNSVVAYAQVVNLDGTFGVPYEMPTIHKTDNVLQASVAGNMPGVLWRVTLHDNAGGVSNDAFINKADPFFSDQDQIVPGTAFRVFGRNMRPPLATAVSPYVQFVDANGGVTAAAVIQVDDTSATVTVPNNIVAGATYNVFYSNGVGGVYGATQLAETVKGHAANDSDRFGLGVFWGHDFGFAANVYDAVNDSRLAQHVVCDGVTDDGPAMAASLYYIHLHNGGTYQLPAGTCRVNGQIQLLSNFIIQGAGKGATVITYGHASTSPNIAETEPLFYFNSSHYVGLKDLTVTDVGYGFARGLQLSGGGGTSSYIFLKNFELTYLHGAENLQGVPNETARGIQGVGGSDVDHVIIADSSLISPTASAIQMYSPKYLTIKNTVFDYRFNRVVLISASNLIFEHNTINFITDKSGNNIESGGTETSYGHNVVIAHNTIGGTIVDHPSPSGSGELIMTQQGAGYFSDVGNVTAATAIAVTDNAKNWPAGYGMEDRNNIYNANLAGTDYSLAIISGKGAGQIRDVFSKTGNTVNVTKPFTVIPDYSSKFVVSRLTANQQIITDNTLHDSDGGTVIWQGMVNSIINNNKHNRAGTISVRSVDTYEDYLGLHSIRNDGSSIYSWSFTPSYNNEISGNEFRNSNNRTRGAIVIDSFLSSHWPSVVPTQYHVVDYNRGSSGMSAFDNTIRDNKVYSYVATPVASNEHGGNEGYFNGLWAPCRNATDTAYVTCDADPQSNQGTIFLRNELIGPGPLPYQIKGPIYDTIVDNKKMIGNSFYDMIANSYSLF